MSPPDRGAPEGSRVGASGESLEDERLRELLRLVREGRHQMDELSDSLGITGVEAGRLVERAERAGLLEREGATGIGRYTVRLTSEGARAIPPPTEREQRLAEFDLNAIDYRTLTIVAREGTCSSHQILQSLPEELEPMRLIPVIVHLVREGYLKESGLWQRYVSLTPSGRQVLRRLEEEIGEPGAEGTTQPG